MPTPSVARMIRTEDEISSAVDDSLFALQHWAEEQDYAGYEPFDILNSPLLSGSAATVVATCDNAHPVW
jgi:hypothetical protein